MELASLQGGAVNKLHKDAGPQEEVKNRDMDSGPENGSAPYDNFDVGVRTGEPAGGLRIEQVYMMVGGMGLYQWISFTLLSVIAFFSVESVNINFVAGSQDHWCAVDELTANFSHRQQKYIAIPDQDGVYEECERFDLNYSGYTEDELVNWNRTKETEGAGRVSCTSWVYDQSMYTSTITSKFDLVCDDDWLVAMVSTLFMAGVLVGAVISGYISDRYGRKITLYGGIILKIGSTFLATFSVHYAMTGVGRFLMGAANSATYLTSFVLIMEIVEGNWRTILGVVYQILFSVGYMVWPGLSYYIRDDVKLQVTMAAPLVLLLSYWLLIDESPRFMLQKKRFAEADQLLRKISIINRSPLPEKFEASQIEMVGEQRSDKTCFDLLRSPKMRLRTLVVDLYWFTVSLMYYALSLNTGELSGDIFVNTVINGAVEIPASILAIILMAWPLTGRRLTCALSLVIAGLASYVSVYMILEDIGLAHTIFSIVAKGFVSLAFFAIYVFTSELFPTEVRNIGIGTASMCARISGMGASYVGGPLGDVWAPLPPVVYGTFAVVSGLLMLLLPETLGAPMFKTIEEAEAFSNKTAVGPVSTELVEKVEGDLGTTKAHYDNRAFDGAELEQTNVATYL